MNASRTGAVSEAPEARSEPVGAASVRGPGIPARNERDPDKT